MAIDEADRIEIVKALAQAGMWGHWGVVSVAVDKMDKRLGEYVFDKCRSSE